MTMPQTRHYEMKDSGVEWIGKMPRHWEQSDIGALYALRNTKVSDKEYPPLSVTKRGILPQLETVAKTNDGDNRKLVRTGDFAINSRSDRRGSCGISTYDGSVSLINTVLTPRGAMHPGFYGWLFHTEQFADEFYKWGHGIVDDLWTTCWSEMKSIIVPTPPLAEQAAIAAYLDEKCTTIDAIITEAKATIEEYKSWKASVIFETVTKGLNPNAEMKDSGVEWIGEIPKGWNLMPFGKIASIKACLVPPKEYPLLPQISPDNIEKGSARLLQNYKTVQESGVISWNHHFYKGQIIYSKVRPTLNKLFLAQFEGLCSADMYPIETTQDARYLVYAMLSGYFVQQVAAITANRVKMPKINKQELSKITVLLPPLLEQASIVSYLDRKCSLIDAIILEKEDLIKELENYKRSLIFEVVTGKRRVC